jgi:hypothetical protein
MELATQKCTCLSQSLEPTNSTSTAEREVLRNVRQKSEVSCICFSWGSFVVILAVLGVVGSSWGGRERSRAVLGRPLVAVMPREGYLGAFLDRPGSSRWFFGSPWGPMRAPKRSLKTTKKQCENRCKKRWHVATVVRPTWGDLGPMLVPSWATRRVKIVLSPRAGLIF